MLLLSKSKFIGLYFAGLVGLIGIIGSGCSTETIVQSIETPETIRRDHQIAIELREGFEKQVTFKKDTEVSVYLRNLASKLSVNTPELGMPVGIFMIRDIRQKWYNVALPGGRVYLSLSMLKKLPNENEIAALMGIQLGHLLSNHVFERLKDTIGMEHFQPAMAGFSLPSDPPEKVDFFGPDGVFAFSEKEEAEAARSAVGILYRAGFDSRGVLSIFEQFKNNQKHSPYVLSTIDRLMDKTRQEYRYLRRLGTQLFDQTIFFKFEKGYKACEYNFYGVKRYYGSAVFGG